MGGEGGAEGMAEVTFVRPIACPREIIYPGALIFVLPRCSCPQISRPRASLRNKWNLKYTFKRSPRISVPFSSHVSSSFFFFLSERKNSRRRVMKTLFNNRARENCIRRFAEIFAHPPRVTRRRIPSSGLSLIIASHLHPSARISYH